MARVRPTARATSTIGVVQKSPMLHARGGEAGRLGGDRQVARGHELAAGRGGEALDPRDHRLRHAVEQQHGLGAGVEDPARGGRRRPR